MPLKYVLNILQLEEAFTVEEYKHTHTHTHKQLFNNDEIFNVDLSREGQMASIPQILHQLIQLLLEGGTFNNNNYSTCFSNIVNNISKLIWYNVVKYQSQDTVTYVRHSRSNKPPLSVAVVLMVYMRTCQKSLVNQLAHEGLSLS